MEETGPYPRPPLGVSVCRSRSPWPVPGPRPVQRSAWQPFSIVWPSLNYQLRKVTKTRGHFPTEDAVLKILYLAIRNIGNNRGGELGTGTQGWKQALNAFAITFPGRLDPTT